MLPVLPIAEARGLVRTADVILWRGGTRLDDVVTAKAGRGRYVHASLAAWWDDELMVIETAPRVGCRAVALHRLVRQRPLMGEVFRLRAAAGWQRDEAARFARAYTGHTYGWRSWWGAAMRHLLLLRVFARTAVDDRENGRLLDCSGIISASLRSAGIDLVPNLPDYLTEPNDLSRSSALERTWALAPDRLQV